MTPTPALYSLTLDVRVTLGTLLAACAAVAITVAAPAPVYAQADDDLLGDLGGDDGEGEDLPTSSDDDLLDLGDDEEEEEEDLEEDEPPVEEAEEPKTEEIKAAPADDAPKRAPKAAEPEESDAPEQVVLDRVKAVPRKSVLKVGRLEITPIYAMSLNDPYYNHFATGGSLTYFLHDSLGISLTGLYFLGHVDSDSVGAVREAQTSVPAVFELPDFIGSIDINFVPIYGKISLFNSFIIAFDTYFLAGFGAARAGEVCADDNKCRTWRPAVEFGLGQRFFVSDWFALRFELRDYMFLDTHQVDRQQRSDVQNYLMFEMGVGLYIPTSFEYSRL